MKKEYTIKVYAKRAGAHSPKIMMEIVSGNGKPKAFALGRQELLRIAKIDLDRGLCESSEADILEEVKSIKNGSNDYNFDQTTWYFKVFSKSVKN